MNLLDSAKIHDSLVLANDANAACSFMFLTDRKSFMYVDEKTVQYVLKPLNLGITSLSFLSFIM